MAELKIENTTYTDLTNTVEDYSVDPAVIEDGQTGGMYYANPNWSRNLGYVKRIPELRGIVESFSNWVCGLGFAAAEPYKSTLEHFTGNGKQTAEEIFLELYVTMLVNGDAFAEIIYDDKETRKNIVNLKVMNPARTRIHINEKGIIDHYEEYDPKKREVKHKFDVKDIFHISVGRLANEVHGTSPIDSCIWIVDARNEAMEDKRRLMHRSAIRVIEVDVDQTDRLATLKEQYAQAIKNGEVLIVPKDNVTFPDVPPISTAEHSDWIRYLENQFYLAMNYPKIIAGGSQEYTEAASKMGHLTFEVPHKSARNKYERQIWQQLQLKLDFDEPPSIKDEVATSEAANTGQTNFQQGDFNTVPGRQ